MRVITDSAQNTIALGKKFFKALAPQDIVVLEGDLGGGKTTFIKGVLDGFGYKKKVLSPSFTLVRQYKIKNKSVYHIDLYRLKRKDCLDIGIEDLIYSKDSLALIEWGDKIRKDLDKYIDIKFIFLGENKRKLIFSTKGHGKDKLQSIKKAFKDEAVRV